jgi:hypothetical protein
VTCRTFRRGEAGPYYLQIDEEDGQSWDFKTLEEAREFLKKLRAEGNTHDFFIELYLESHEIVR